MKSKVLYFRYLNTFAVVVTNNETFSTQVNIVFIENSDLVIKFIFYY